MDLAAWPDLSDRQRTAAKARARREGWDTAVSSPPAYTSATILAQTIISAHLDHMTASFLASNLPDLKVSLQLFILTERRRNANSNLTVLG